MERLTNRNIEIPSPRPENADYWRRVHLKLADYEDAEEAGILVRLPCKPREVVWVYYPKYKEIERIAYMTRSEILEDIELGAVICKTREEAEAALAKED